MSGRIGEDLAEMRKKLSEYVDKGQVVGYHEVRKEPVIAVKPDVSKIKPLKKMRSCDVHFMAVDCSTRTLKRANNWGVYLLRVAYALVRGRNVDWGYEERIGSVIGDTRTRYRFLEDARVELESKMALPLLREGGEVHELLSPLTFISGDPRCLGYPVALWLAHDFSSPSDSKLLYYHDQVEEMLASAGLLDVLRVEELSCNFSDELHGVKHPFRWEWIGHV